MSHAYHTASMADPRGVAHVVTVGSEQARAAWRVAAAQPGWVRRLTLLAFLVVVGIPIALLFLLASFVALLTFGVLAGAHLLSTKVRALMPRRDGRENVRVIQRREGPR